MRKKNSVSTGNDDSGGAGARSRPGPATAPQRDESPASAGREVRLPAAGGSDTATNLADVLRRRIISAVMAGLISHGDRLQSVREVARQLGVDPRMALAAYRALAEEGLVEMRPRSGVYVAVRNDPQARLPVLSEGWVVDLLAQGIGREISAVELPEWLRRCVDTLRLRVVSVGGTCDIAEGLSGELKDDYGLDGTAVLLDALDDAASLRAIRQADLLICTAAAESIVRQVAERMAKPVIVVSFRSDLVSSEWHCLLERPVYAVICDADFEPQLRQRFAEVDVAGNLRVHVVGRDDTRSIPRDAPAYVTRAARARLRPDELPARVVTTARVLSDASARELLAFIVRANLAVLDAVPA